MQTRLGFTLMSLAEFEDWIARFQLARTVVTMQQHHTWSPHYGLFSGNNHFELQQGMKHHHVVNNGWDDIGQHFTTFPDGTVMTGRSLERTPACIKGNNAHAVCVEHLGNFDAGRDEMTAEHRETVVRLTAAISTRFVIQVNADRIIYHHWFDLDTGARTNGAGNTKSCPGTAFFGGNTVRDAQRTFYPRVRRAISGRPASPAPSPGMRYGSVTASSLHVRSGPGTDFKKVNTVHLGSILRLFDTREDWAKISAGRDEWVSERYITPVARATIRVGTLNVRSGPGTTFTKLAALAKGQEVFVYERQDGWCRIGAEQRWVKEEFLTLA